MRKFILYACVALVLSFYTAAKIEAGFFNNIKEVIKDVTPDPTDPCAGGAVECTYVFTAKSGSDKPITMARRPVGIEYSHDDGYHDNHGDEYRSTDWYYYDLPFYTKSQVQAGYYIDESDNNKLVLMMVYSADKEGKGGAIVSRISKDYGESWSESKNVTDNKHKFGLAVAPNSRFVAISIPPNLVKFSSSSNNASIALHEFIWDNENSWTDWYNLPNKLWKVYTPISKGLSVIYDDTLEDPLVSVAYANRNDRLQIRNYSMSDMGWNAKVLTAMTYTNDTAWLCNDRGTDTRQYLAVKKYVVTGENGNYLGVRKTDDLEDYSGFKLWRRQEKYPISGMWKCPDKGTIYILSTYSQQIWGHFKNASGNKDKKILYESNQNSSMQRRVSMFNVPAK